MTGVTLRTPIRTDLVVTALTLTGCGAGTNPASEDGSGTSAPSSTARTAESIDAWASDVCAASLDRWNETSTVSWTADGERQGPDPHQVGADMFADFTEIGAPPGVRDAGRAWAGLPAMTEALQRYADAGVTTRGTAVDIDTAGLDLDPVHAERLYDLFSQEVIYTALDRVGPDCSSAAEFPIYDYEDIVEDAANITDRGGAVVIGEQVARNARALAAFDGDNPSDWLSYAVDETNTMTGMAVTATDSGDGSRFDIDVNGETACIAFPDGTVTAGTC